MRKISKAVAALTAGCMLLSTSAFAAGTLTGTPAVEEDLIKVTVANLGVGQSTILALKGDYTAIPSDLSAEEFAAKILYIDQMPAANDAASYTINPGTYEGDVSIFAGGTNQTEASYLGKVSTVKVINPTGITIEGAKEELVVGETLELTAVIAPNGAEGTIIWNVTEGEVVSVENGKVTALKAGNATVTATIEGTEFSDSVSIAVKQLVEDLTLVADKTTLEIGETATITATVLPEDATDKTIVWSNNVVADGATATFTAPEVDEDTEFTVTATAGGITKEVVITVKAEVAGSTVIKGDVVGTIAGEINLDDAAAVLQMALKAGTWTDAQIAAADVVGSIEGEVNLDDAAAVLQKALKADVSFKD